jgi:hypothetical protein
MSLRDNLRFKRTSDLSVYTEPVREMAVAAPPDPRKRTSGTSLTTEGKGSLPVSPGAYNEAGSSRGGLTRDRIPQLGTLTQAVQTYDAMANSDPAVDVSLRAGKMPIMGALFFIQPYNEDQINLDIAEFVKYNLLKGTSAPFLLILEDILRMYEYGFSVFEKVYELREWAPNRTMANRRNYTMLKKLSPRPSPTIKEIQYDDNGGPVGVVHRATRADKKLEEVEIPIDKLIIFSFNKKGGNLEGKSLLRTAYQPWYYKDNLYKIDGIQKERHGIGFPVVEAPPGATDDEVRAAKALVQNVRTNEFGGMVLPPGFVFRFADLPGQPVDVMKSIEHHNGMIMLNVMVQFLLMGLQVTGGGGRATAGAMQDTFTKSLRYVGNLICDWINFYLVPQLVAYNFDTDRFPQLQVKNIGETKDLQQWASGLANLIARNAITVDYDLEQWVRSIVDAPPKTGGRQTPENNPGNTIAASSAKGDVQGSQDATDGGNTPAPTDNAGSTPA